MLLMVGLPECDSIRCRLAIDEQGDGLVQKRLRKGRIVLHARSHGIFEITGQ
jgi:hypothetical protein